MYSWIVWFIRLFWISPQAHRFTFRLSGTDAISCVELVGWLELKHKIVWSALSNYQITFALDMNCEKLDREMIDDIYQSERHISSFLSFITKCSTEKFYKFKIADLTYYNSGKQQNIFKNLSIFLDCIYKISKT